MPGDWRVVSPYLDQALELPEHERGPWLASLRQRDPTLASELETLLRDHRLLTRDGFLESASPLHRLPFVGGQIGAYTLTSLIGEGGMGSVWLAERTDGEIRQQVAIKFLGIRRQPAWQARFLRERQVLASLNHPAIVRAIDAGRLEDGEPYLVMEYVEGTPIDEHVSAMSSRERLLLFLRVCDAVSYAHQHLVVHRDLKPSNILVTARGDPKLLDFGIAKLLDESQEVTRTVERVLTPAYASPEQLAGGPQTTATDVYSLGAVLYQLLTGQTLRPRARGLDSGRDAADVPSASRVNPALPRDIDYVLRRALREEPAARYVTVEAFASDIRAVVDSQPVAARAGERWYRTQKFVTRYWAPVVGTTIVLLGLAAGLFVVNRERAIAERRFNDVRELSNKLFDIDDQVRVLPGSSKVRQLIVDTSLEYLRRLAPARVNDPSLALDIGQAYLSVARVQGVPTSPNLGQMEEADESLSTADQYVQGVLRANASNQVALVRAAQIAAARMVIARFRARYADERTFAHQSAAWLNEVDVGRVDQPLVRDVLSSYLNVASEYARNEDNAEARALCDRAIEIGRSRGVGSYVGNLLWVKAESFQREGDLERALQSVRESVNELESVGAVGQNPLADSLSLALSMEGKMLGQDDIISAGRYQEAAIILERSFAIADEFVHRDPTDQLWRNRLADPGVNLGDVLRHTDPRRALDVYDHTLRHLAEIKNNTAFRRFEASALAASSYALDQLGQFEEARRRLAGVFERLKALGTYPAAKIRVGSEAADAVRARAEWEADTGDLPRAIRSYDELLAANRAAGAQPRQRLSDALNQSTLMRSEARVERRAGRADDAARLEAEDISLWDGWQRKLPDSDFVRRQVALAARHDSRGSRDGDR